jgi:hypothetical protein
VLVGIFVAGAVYFATTSDPYRTAAPLDVTAYLENSNSLRGNTYRAEGEISNVLGYSATEGRLISVTIDASGEIVPMLIPPELGDVNIQKGQKFRFLIEVTDKGILKATHLTKA